jgi:hypothetical protein
VHQKTQKKKESPCLNFAQEMLQKGDLKGWRGRDDERERERERERELDDTQAQARCLASQEASILLAIFLPKSELK